MHDSGRLSSTSLGDACCHLSYILAHTICQGNMTAGTFLIWMEVWVWGSRVPDGALSLEHFPGYLYGR